MVKHTQTIRRQQPTNCLSVFIHFVRLALKGIKSILMFKRSKAIWNTFSDSGFTCRSPVPKFNWNSLNRYSLYKVVWRILKLILIASKKSIYCSRLILFKSPYCLGWNILLTGLFIWWFIHLIILLSQCINRIIHLFIIGSSYFFLSI